MMRKWLLFALVILAALPTLTVQSQSNTPDPALVAGNQQFALDVYQQLQEGSSDNFLFSPYSISQALAMTYAGAEGQTAQEMAAVLHFDLPEAELHPAFDTLNTDLLTPPAEVVDEMEYQEGEPLEFRIANALWGQAGFAVEADYQSTVNQYYSGNFYEVDFQNDLEPSRQMINAWVGDQTAQRIPDLIPEGVLSPASRLVLTNATYLKAGWLYPFYEYSTEPAPFTLLDGTQAEVMMMNRWGDKFTYTALDNYQVVSMPYFGNDLAMWVILPNADEFETVEAGLDSSMFQMIRATLHFEEYLNVWIPRFEYESEFQLGDTLRTMGMPTAFDGAASDFSGIHVRQDENDRLTISEVIHKAFIAVDEKGTEAAAATAVIMETGAAMPTETPPPPIEFRADRPFIWAIVDESTGTILFMGRLTNP